LRDVLPTLAEAAGARVPEIVEGKSMLDLARGKTDGWRKWIDLEHDVCYDPSNHWNGLTDGRTKYIFHAPDASEQLFDLAADPHETHDLAGDAAHTELLATWRARMVEHLSERGEAWVKGGKLQARPERQLYSPNYPGKV
jgi:arylsulfatase A-like enzyme